MHNFRQISKISVVLKNRLVYTFMSFTGLIPDISTLLGQTRLINGAEL